MAEQEAKPSKLMQCMDGFSKSFPEAAKKMGYRSGKSMKAFARLYGGPATWQIAKNRDGNRVAPERYLEAAGEIFILMLAVCWIITAIWNPDIISSNLLKDVVGYNNLCVGFDSSPARYIAVPLFTVMSYFAIRYVVLDTLRADLEFKSGALASKHYKFTVGANMTYAVFMTCWPMLLVVTPDIHTVTHTFIFFAMIICSYLVTAANFAESPNVTLKSKIWFGFFTTFSVMLPLVGIVDFRGYKKEACLEGTADGIDSRG